MLQLRGIAPSTKRTYQAGMTRFVQFCAQFNLNPLPASHLTLRYFCTYLSPSVRLTTIKLYLSAIRFHHIRHEHQDPTRDTLLQYVVKGIKRTQSLNTRQRLPITLQVLKALKSALHNSPQFTYHDKRMLWAAFVVAFYGFLGAGELCSKSVNSFDPDTTLLWSDVTTTTKAVMLHIQASKTDPFRNGCTITIGATTTSTCPLNAVQHYRAIHQHQPSSPAFTFQDGSLLTRQALLSSSENFFCLRPSTPRSMLAIPSGLGQQPLQRPLDCQNGRSRQWVGGPATVTPATSEFHSLPSSEHRSS